MKRQKNLCAPWWLANFQGASFLQWSLLKEHDGLLVKTNKEVQILSMAKELHGDPYPLEWGKNIVQDLKMNLHVWDLKSHKNLPRRWRAIITLCNKWVATSIHMVQFYSQ